MPTSDDDLARTSGPYQSGSLRLRVALMIIMLSTVIHGVIGLVVGMYVRRESEAVFDQRIRARVERMGKSIDPSDSAVSSDYLKEFVSHSIDVWSSEPSLAVVYDAEGEPMAQSGPVTLDAAHFPLRDVLATPGVPVALMLQNVELPTPRGPVVVPQARAGLLSLTPSDGPPLVLAFIRSDADAQTMLHNVDNVILALVMVGVVATGAAGWLVTGRILIPLQNLAKIATSLRPDNLEQDIETPEVTVSELRNVQNSLQETRDSLRLAFRAQERFLTNVAHELKTPVAVLLTEAQTINRTGLSADGLAFVKSVDEEMRRLGKLVESFLLLAKLRAGKTLPRVEPVSINEAVMGAVEQCALMARQHDVTLHPTLIECQSDLPVDSVTGDPALVKTMIDIIIRNAIKFSPHPSVVRVTAALDGECVKVLVLDQGPGIPDEIATTLFDRFVQSPSEVSRGRGTGLGLAIAQGIAELHGGKITFCNQSSAGCEFKIALPRTGAGPIDAIPVPA